MRPQGSDEKFSNLTIWIVSDLTKWHHRLKMSFGKCIRQGMLPRRYDVDGFDDENMGCDCSVPLDPDRSTKPSPHVPYHQTLRCADTTAGSCRDANVYNPMHIDGHEMICALLMPRAFGSHSGIITAKSSESLRIVQFSTL